MRLATTHNNSTHNGGWGTESVPRGRNMNETRTTPRYRNASGKDIRRRASGNGSTRFGHAAETLCHGMPHGVNGGKTLRSWLGPDAARLGAQSHSVDWPRKRRAECSAGDSGRRLEIRRQSKASCPGRCHRNGSGYAGGMGNTPQTAHHRLVTRPTNMTEILVRSRGLHGGARPHRSNAFRGQPSSAAVHTHR